MFLFVCPQFRYFLQPFLILYYAPLFILRGLTGPSAELARKKRRLVLEGWKDAVEHAERAEAGGYWPVRVDCKFILKTKWKLDRDQ